MVFHTSSSPFWVNSASLSVFWMSVRVVLSVTFARPEALYKCSLTVVLLMEPSPFITA